MKKDYLFLMLMTGFLFSCVGSIQPSEPTVTPQYLDNGTANTPMLSGPPVQTATIAKPAPTLTPTLKPSPTMLPLPTRVPGITHGSIPVCQGEGEVLAPSKDFGFNGTIVYQLDVFDGLYTIGGVPLRQSQLPVDQTQKYDVYGFSPDGKWLAYSPIPPAAFKPGFVLEDFAVALISDEREHLVNTMDVRDFVTELPRDPEYQLDAPVSVSWINNQLIYTNLAARSEEKTEYGYYYHLPKVFNPFTGDWISEIFTNLPHRSNVSVAFSFDLKRALYFEPPKHLSLLDLESEKTLWSNKKFTTDISMIITKWAPDDSMALVANTTFQTFKVSLVTRNGRLFRHIASDSYPSDHFFPLGIAWSPNARYIAMSQLKLLSDQIYVYDVKQDTYLFKCPVSGLYLVWSPDSRYVAIGGENAPLQVLEIETGKITEIAPYGIPVGWSNSFPVDWP